MPTLPDDFTALRFACDCLGVTEDDLYPQRRQDLHRAEGGGPISDKKRRILEDKMEEVLLRKLRAGKLRRRGVVATDVGVGAAKDIIDELFFVLRRIYRDMSPLIRWQESAASEALWVLAREIFVPTVHLVFAQHQNRGLGTEFRLGSTWYVPQCVGVEFMQPVSIILDRWLRTSGFRTAYGVAKPKASPLSDRSEKAWATQRKQVKSWLDGKTTPALQRLYALVDGFQEKVEWLDTAESWRARFTLAFAVSRALRAADKVFAEMETSPSEQLVERFLDLDREPIWSDVDGLLVQPSTYFAVKLWLRHLEVTGQLAALKEGAPKSFSPSFGTAVADEEIEQARQEAARSMNFGNHIAQHLLAAAGASRNAGDASALLARNQRVRDFLLKFAANELNDQIARTVKTPGAVRSPRRAQFKRQRKPD
jgi:hypothetical protein